MKNRVIKRLSIILSICTLILSGCGDSKSQQQNVKPEESKLTGKIDIWCLKGSEDNIDYALKSFITKNPKVTYNITSLDGDAIKQKLSDIYFSKATPPDIIQIKDSDLEFYVDKYEDKLTDLNGSLGSVKDKLIKWKVSQATFNDKLYAVPWNINPVAVIYNKRLADTFQINPSDIKTWDQYLQAANIVQNKSQNTVKMMAVKESKDNSMFLQLLKQQGNNLYNKKGELNIDSQNAVKAMGVIKKLYDLKEVYDLKDNENIYDVLNGDKVFSAIIGGDTIATILKNASANKGKWQLENFPAFEPGGQNMVCEQADLFLMFRKEALNKAAAEYLKFMVSDKDLCMKFLKEKGMISANTSFFYYPYTNSPMESFNTKKVWRYMCESALECKKTTYGLDYGKLYNKLLEGQHKVISGEQDSEKMLSEIQE